MTHRPESSRARATALAITVTLVAACGQDVALGGGDAAAVDAPHDATIDAPIDAAIDTPPMTITVTVVGDGEVTSAPAGVSCGTTCTATFPAATAVTLTATPVPGARFVGWSGGACGGAGPCVVVDTAAVTATFALEPLRVTRSGDGTGRVTSSPAGIDCGTDCEELYPPGATVALVALADPGSQFVGWTSGCTGSGVCTTTNGVTVDARFERVPFPLTVAVTGHGTVTSTPAGIDCGVVCVYPFPGGTVVRLDATAAPGSAFVGWSSGCTGSGACLVNVNSPVTVGATFAP